MPECSIDPSEVARLLLAWYGERGRELPWRQTRDPYRIWLSEIMLQQTGVLTVIPYYERFLAAFPDLAALAAAPVEAVIEHWAGLGYYSRARHLRAAARQVVHEHGGVFPDTLEGLMSLSGVGRSTAGAILSIAFDVPAPILDGNVRRVLCRLFAVTDDPRSAPVERLLWERAAALTPADRPHDYAQAIMDLGATVCTPSNPACPACPLEALCRARALGLETELPRRRAKKTVPLVVQTALVLERDGKTLVRRRPLAGLLGGLWEFPSATVADGSTPEEVASRLLAELGLEALLAPTGTVRHLYSHFRTEVHVFTGTVSGAGRVAEEGGRWCEAGELSALALHGAHKKILPLLASRC